VLDDDAIFRCATTGRAGCTRRIPVLRKLALLLVSLPLVSLAHAASTSNTVSGSGALALAALVGAQSPNVSAAHKSALADMLNGNLGFPGKEKITVKADKVSCRSSNVDISAHSCELTFGGAKRTLTGRTAHELYATLVEVGVPSDGAAGSIFESVTMLTCNVDVGAVKDKAGGGADCTFTAGQ
jgi:hypothetical protein